MRGENRWGGAEAESYHVAVYTNAENASLYDVINPWDPGRFPSDRFYVGLVMAADSVLDVGCGTGAMLHLARDRGHQGRLVGLDPDPAMLGLARRRDDIDWVAGTAAEAGFDAEFGLATMASNAFQCLIGDEDVRASLTAIRRALRPGGGFAFETRHPQARAWQDWNPSRVADVVDASGRALRTWHEVESADGGVVTMTETVADPDGTILRVDRGTLRFVDVAPLNDFLTEAGFEVSTQWGDFDGEPITGASRSIVTVARRPAG